MFTVCGLWSYDSSSLHLTEINILNSSKMNDSSKQNCGSTWTTVHLVPLRLLVLEFAGVSKQANKQYTIVSQTEVNRYQTFSEVLGLSEFTTAKQTGPSFRGELLETIQNTYMSICHNHKNVSYTLHMAGTHDNTHTLHKALCHHPAISRGLWV